jgi:hypothetical protein
LFILIIKCCPKVCLSDTINILACTNIAVAFPDKSLVKQTENYIFDNDLGDWRHTTFADRLCVPEIKSEFNLGLFIEKENYRRFYLNKF